MTSAPQQPTDPHTSHAPSGRQFEINHGQQQATVVEVGGGLRRYRIGEQDLLDGYSLEQRCTGARGLPLIPWPNRIQDGTYRFEHTDYQVPLTEPENHNAIHGFLRWRNWTCQEHSATTVTMGTVLHPQMGYPFTLKVSVQYSLDADGLTVVTSATNIGNTLCPYGTGQHPYLSPGTGTTVIDPCQLQFEAETWLPTDERGLPTGRAMVTGSDYDFRTPRTIGTQDIDYTFTDLARDRDGRAWVRLNTPEGFSLAFWADESYPYLEIYTAHTQPEPHWRTGLGVEPMTCAPNAFRSGEGLIHLEPGESSTAAWGLHTG